MNQVAFILENSTIYWHSIVLALSVLAGICFFMACCNHLRIANVYAAATVMTALVLSLLISRLMYWYSRADSFKSLWQALTTSASSSYSLTGVFIGCILAALLLHKCVASLPKLLDCMSVAGCGAIALGRLSNFFTTADRGQIVTEMTYLPWSYPVMNAASGLPDYRLATFVFQSIITAILFVVLAFLFFYDRKKTRIPHGDITLLFTLVYSASQVLLDSTRYDSLYFRSNGFVSIVQVLCAVALGFSIIWIAIRAVKAHGMQRWMIAVWVIIAALFGLAGYMEYYVQRHGKLAFFSYSVMEHCLIGILVLAICLWRKATENYEPSEEPVIAPVQSAAEKPVLVLPKLPKVDLTKVMEKFKQELPKKEAKKSSKNTSAKTAEKPKKKKAKEHAAPSVTEEVSEVLPEEIPEDICVMDADEIIGELSNEADETTSQAIVEVTPDPVEEDTPEPEMEIPEEPVEEPAEDPEEVPEKEKEETESQIISDDFFAELFSDLPAGFLDDVSDDWTKLLSE